jgi:hypothetical protein
LVEGLDIDGGVWVEARGVRLRNVVVSGPVVVAPQASVRLENVAIFSPTVGIQLEGTASAAVFRSHIEAPQGVTGGIDLRVEACSWVAPFPSTGSFVDLAGGRRSVIAFNHCQALGGACVTGTSSTIPLRDALLFRNTFEGSGFAAVWLPTMANVGRLRLIENQVGPGFGNTPLKPGTDGILERNTWLADGGLVPEG